MRDQIREIDEVIKHLGQSKGISRPYIMKLIQLLADYRKLLKFHPVMQHEDIRIMPLGKEVEE